MTEDLEIDFYCADDDKDTTARVTDDNGERVLLAVACCDRELELTSAEFREHLH